MSSLAAAAQLSFEQAVARWWRPALLVTALVLGALTRMTFGRGMPLWFDETFTGVIASQDSMAGLWRWLRTELTGPFFYGSYWLWARVAGVSTEALRLPGLVFTLAAPLLVLRGAHRDATMRLLWAAILLLWLPMAVFASDARPYAMLVLLGTLQIAAFCALLRTPTRARALLWVLPTLAMGLTHYVALLPGLVQGLMLLGVQRGAALRLWPATLPFAVLAGWMVLHLPFVAEIGGAGAVMSDTMRWQDVARLPSVMVGDTRFGLLLLLPLGWVLASQLRAGGQRGWRPSPEWWAAMAGVGGFGAMFAVACLLPGMAMRYFMPTMPALIFALAWWLRTALDRSGVPVAAFFAAMMIGGVGLTASSLADPALDQRHAFGVDLPSRWLMEKPPQHVLFFWGDPTAVLATGYETNLEQVGGFFLKQAGSTAPVELVNLPHGTDAAATIGARAAARPGTAILWVGNAPSADPLRQTAPLFRDPRWECRDFAQDLAVSVACRPR